MSDRIAELRTQSGDIDVVIVTFTSERSLRGYQRRFAPNFVVVTNPERDLYREFGFNRGSVRRVWGWRAARKYLSLLRSGHRIEREASAAKEDTLQLGGNVIVGPDGITRWVYQGAGPDDRPTVDRLAEVLAEIR